MARQRIETRPAAVGVQRYAHWRQVSSFSASPSLAGLPRAVVDAHLDPTDPAGLRPRDATDRRHTVGRSTQRPEPVDGVDPAHQLDRCPVCVPARHPVLLEVLEGGQLDLGQPLGGGDVAVQARHDQPDGEPVFQRAVARRSCRTPRAHCVRRWPPRSGSRTCSRRPSDRRPDWLRAGHRPRRAARRGAPRATGRCRSARHRSCSRRMSSVMSCSTTLRRSRSSNVRLSSRSTMPVTRSS